MIRFVPNGTLNSVSGGAWGGADNTTDASYHLPQFYELWARWGPKEDRAFWARAAASSRRFLPGVAGAETALTPDRSHFDQSPLRRSGELVPFGYDSWRTVSNWSVDYAWFAKSPAEPALSERYQKFLTRQGIHTFADRYTIRGEPLSTRHSPGMVSTAAVGGLALGASGGGQTGGGDTGGGETGGGRPGGLALGGGGVGAETSPYVAAFVNELWELPIPTGEQRYYDGMLYLMSLLHCSGKFRIWMPEGKGLASKRPESRSAENKSPERTNPDKPRATPHKRR